MDTINFIRSNEQYDRYILNLLTELGIEVSFLSWHESEDVTADKMIVLLDESKINELIEILQVADNKVIVALHSRKDFKLINHFKLYLDAVFGFIDLSQENDYNTPIIQNYKMTFGGFQESPVGDLSNDIDKIFEFTKNELNRVKDLHDRLVKLRVDKYKGVSLSSKFMAGEKSGGEFFDVIENDGSLFFFLAGTNDYIQSSLMISELENLKKYIDKDSFHEHFSSFDSRIIQHAQENGAQLNFCILHLNMKTLELNGRFMGEGYLIYENGVIDFTRPVKLKLKPEDKFFIVSQGAIKNLREKNPEFNIDKFFIRNDELGVKDLINDFFFQVSKNKSGRFLTYDAVMNAFEIEQKVLYQV